MTNRDKMLNQCHIGDCRTLLKDFAAASVRARMCVTSPPYFGLRDYGADGQIGLEASPSEYVAEMVGVFAAVRDVLADDGTLWLNLGDSYGTGASGQNFDPASGATNRGGQGAAGSFGHKKQPPVRGFHKNLLGIPWRVAFALQADGWYLRSDIIWHKPNPMPESVTDRPTKAHEYLFLLAKSERYYYDADAIREPFAFGDPRPMGNRNAAARRREKLTGNMSPDAVESTLNPLGRNKRSVWSIISEPFDGAHFATFPRALIEPCILAGSRPGDVVIDPFMGSGTTAQVAEHLGRQWIGCELNPDYMPLQAKRLAQRAMAF